MRKILFVVALAVTAMGVREMRAEAGCGGGMVPTPPVAVKVDAKVAAGAALQVPYVAPHVGEVATITDDMSVTGTIKMGGKSMPMKQQATETYTQEVVEASGDTVSKLKLTFKSAHMKADAMGMKQDQDLPVKGHAYVVTSDKGKAAYVKDGGGTVDAQETAVLQKFGEQVGNPDRMGKLLAGKSFKKGEKVTLSAEEIKAVAPPNEGMTASDVTLTLTGSDAKSATFALAGTFSGKQGPMDMQVTVTGTIKVDLKRSRPTDFKMNGTMTGAGDTGNGKAEFTGKLVAHKAISYK
jgi:hypothetical protein